MSYNKLIIAGSRTLNVSSGFIWGLIETLGLDKELNWDELEIVSGGASGIDKDGEYFAKFNDLGVRIFNADWDEHGKSAGPLRNKQMAEYADALLVIWDGESKDSMNMKLEMQQLGKPVYEVIIRKTQWIVS